MRSRNITNTSITIGNSSISKLGDIFIQNKDLSSSLYFTNISTNLAVIEFTYGVCLKSLQTSETKVLFYNLFDTYKACLRIRFCIWKITKSSRRLNRENREGG